MKKLYLNVLLLFLIMATLSSAIVSAGHHPAHEQNNQQDKSVASLILTSVDPHNGNSCRVCHDLGGDAPDLRSKRNNQRYISATPVVSSTSTEYHHVDSCVVCHDMSGNSVVSYKP